jgi:chromosome segregation ATPase
MTNAEEGEDINVRLEDIDTRLEELGDELDLIRTIQNANRRETRGNSQTIARLEHTIRELSNIARLHQQALRASERNFNRIQEQAERDRLEWRDGINRILQYLRDRNGGSSPPA